MMRRTQVSKHRGGRSRGFLLNDPQLTSLNQGTGFRALKRMGALGVQKMGNGVRKVNHQYANLKYQHAFPLLSHDDMGHNDQSNNTKHIQLSMYMPKRNKATAPWWRGADTYSLKYSEQSRYEYQRYLMIQRFPSQYKMHFMRFLQCINAARKAGSAVPQEAMHWLQRMVVDNFNPQHVHYMAAMKALFAAKELDMSRDVWKLMERQQTWPTNETIVAYLQVCVKAGQLPWALECWNRYCSEVTFLAHGEVDPKPISRVPFSLTREELLHLPKWKKHFDHDPNLDVIDLNRFNITREIYSKMAQVALVAKETALFDQFFTILCDKLLSTPTPIPQPPNPHIARRPQWGPHLNENTQRSEWRNVNSAGGQLLGPRSFTVDRLDNRFESNQQFLLTTVREIIVTISDVRPSDEASPQIVATCEGLLERVQTALTPAVYGALDTDPLFLAYVSMAVRHGRLTGKAAEQLVEQLLADKARAANAPAKEKIHPAIYQVLLRAYADEATRLRLAINLKNKLMKEGGGASGASVPVPTNTPQLLMQQVSLLAQNISRSAQGGANAWSLFMHNSVIECLVMCGTMKANDYFVKNVLRQYRWSSVTLKLLYKEYRLHEDVDQWAELTKRALVWTARYDVGVSDALKRAIEADYAAIGVHTRTMKDLAVFQFRDVEEKRHARNPVNQLPNPWIDHVSHALPFPDRDTGYPNEYGEIGQWRAPGGPGSPTKGPGYYAPAMEGEHMRGYTAEWRDPKNPTRTPPLPGPWDKKYKQYDRGTHPSYDMVYAGPFPEIFPQRTNFRKPTRWDFQDVEKQGKFKINGPW